MNHLKHTYSRDISNLKKLKQKKINNDSVVLKADKGNTTVVMHKNDYTQKVYEFIEKNNITKLKEDPTLI